MEQANKEKAAYRKDKLVRRIRQWSKQIRRRRRIGRRKW
jgi:hypothetical protein